MERIKLRWIWLVAVLLAGQNVWAYDFMVDGLCYNRNSDGTSVTVTYQTSGTPSYASLSGAISIPANVSYGGCTYSVTSIGDWAFAGCSGLTSVTIPNSVTTIGGNGAFSGCSGLTSVTLPNSVVNIGAMAFYNCISLMSLSIPNSVTTISSRAFMNCRGLTSVSIGNSVTSIGDEAFYGCKGLMSVTIPNSVTKIGGSAFKGCIGLMSVIIGNVVTTISSEAFSDCSSLTSVTIPNSVTSIGKYAFQNCSGLTSVTIGNSVTSIGWSAFSGCSGLTSIKVESGNQKYDSRDNCNAIIEIATNILIVGCMNTLIPNSVTSIGSNAFNGCIGLTSVVIPNSVISIGSNAFEGCSGLTSVVIPNSVTSIGDWAFAGCSGLTSVTISNSVTSISDWAFYNCSGLTSVVIPNSVTSIGDYAFENCSRLRNIVIPQSVQNVGCAFGTSEAAPSRQVTLCGSIDLYYKAFYEKTRYTSNSPMTLNALIIKDNVSYVRVSGSSSIGALRSKHIYSYATNPPECNEYTFYNYSATLHVPASAISAYFEAPYWQNFTNIVGDAVEPTALTLNTKTAYVKLGEQLNLQGTLQPSNTGLSLVWDTTDDNIATVNSNGVVTTRKPGECDIIVTCAGLMACCHVVVIEQQIAIMLDKHELEMDPNTIQWLTPSFDPVATEITVDSSDREVVLARVNSNRVQVMAMKPGRAVVTVRSTDGKARPDSCIVTVNGIVPGDANGDGSVNVSDYVTVANYILEEDPQPFVFAAADIDGNEDINVSDLVAVANIALTYEGAPRRQPRPSGAAAELSVAATLAHHAGNHQLMLGLPEDVALAALQMDINLPQGMTVAAARLTGGTSHTVNVERLSAGGYRVLVSSPSNLPIAGEISLTLDGAQPGEVVINHIMLAEPDATLHHAADMTLPLEGAVTGVDDLDNAARIYAKDGKVVIDATVAGMAGFVLPSGASRVVPVQAGHNEFDGFAPGVVIVKLGHEVKKLIL